MTLTSNTAGDGAAGVSSGAGVVGLRFEIERDALRTVFFTFENIWILLIPAIYDEFEFSLQL